MTNSSASLLDELEALSTLLRMKPVNATFGSLCAPGTRSSVLEFIARWVTSNDQQTILWINGTPKIGKSAITNTIAMHMSVLRRKGSLISFERSETTLGSAIQTLAAQLADSDPFIRAEICAAIEARPEVVDDNPGKQFEHLILNPLRNVVAKIVGPILIVIDALEQHGNMIKRRELLSLLSSQFTELPSMFRILVTSRRELDIDDVFSRNPRIKTISLDDLELWNCSQDIKTYLTQEMSYIRHVHGLSANWPGEETIKKMTRMSGGLFAWASRLVEFILHSAYPTQSLDHVAHSGQIPQDPEPQSVRVRI